MITKQFNKAIKCFERSISINNEIQNLSNQAASLINLGSIYLYKSEYNKAIQYWQYSLDVTRKELSPIHYRKASFNIGIAEFIRGNWKLALKKFSIAIELVELNYTSSTTDEDCQSIVIDSIEIYQATIQCYINLKQYDKALEYAERYRCKHLVDLMESGDFSGGETLPKSEQLSQDYDELQQRINDIRVGYQSDDNQPHNWELDAKAIENLEANKQDIWRQIRKLDPILAGQKQIDSLDFEQIQGLISNPTTAILSFYTSKDNTYVFILTQNKTTQLHTCQGQGFKTLQQWLLDNWLKTYLEDKNKWRENIDKNLKKLSQRLRLNELISEHLAGIEELIIVPHLSLHLIPFAALPISNFPLSSVANSEVKNPEEEEKFSFIHNLSHSSRAFGVTPKKTEHKSSATKSSSTTSSRQYLGQRFRLRILPSLQILNYCQQRPY